MFRNSCPLILASGSPRRQQYLREMGLDFKVVVADIDETTMQGEGADSFVARMAKAKCLAVSDYHPEAWVISGDTIVCLDDEILGKPQSESGAVSMLMRLSGREHVVKTGYSIGQKYSGTLLVNTVSTKVIFSEFSRNAAKCYVESGEPLDKAGAYGIQGKGAVLVRSVEGSYSNVVGLPLVELTEDLIRLGAIAYL